MLRESSLERRWFWTVYAGNIISLDGQLLFSNCSDLNRRIPIAENQ